MRFDALPELTFIADSSGKLEASIWAHAKEVLAAALSSFLSVGFAKNSSDSLSLSLFSHVCARFGEPVFNCLRFCVFFQP